MCARLADGLGTRLVACSTTSDKRWGEKPGNEARLQVGLTVSGCSDGALPCHVCDGMLCECLYDWLTVILWHRRQFQESACCAVVATPFNSATRADITIIMLKP